MTRLYMLKEIILENIGKYISNNYFEGKLLF